MKKILNNRFYYNKLQYFVKWLKYSDTDNEWLKSSELDEIQELIRNFHEKYFDKSAKEESNRKKIRIWFYWVFLVRWISSYIYHVDYHHLEHKREIKLNLNTKENSIWIKK